MNRLHVTHNFSHSIFLKDRKNIKCDFIKWEVRVSSDWWTKQFAKLLFEYYLLTKISIFSPSNERTNQSYQFRVVRVDHAHLAGPLLEVLSVVPVVSRLLTEEILELLNGVALVLVEVLRSAAAHIRAHAAPRTKHVKSQIDEVRFILKSCACPVFTSLSMLIFHLSKLYKISKKKTERNIHAFIYTVNFDCKYHH